MPPAGQPLPSQNSKNEEGFACGRRQLGCNALLHQPSLHSFLVPVSDVVLTEAREAEGWQARKVFQLL